MLPNICIWRSGLAILGILVLFATAASAQQAPASPDDLPNELIAPAGTAITIQIDDSLSSNEKSAGDSFVGSLRQPLVIEGWVVAHAGQTVFGQISSANKAGRIRGTSDLGLELTEMVLVDGQQVPVRTQLIVNRGKTSHEQDAATIAGAAAIGTIIGASVGQGKGAAIGAGIGAAAGTAGVLSTRGKAAEIQPETVLTFRLDEPLIVSTVKTARAFVPVAPDDYEKEPALRKTPQPKSAGDPDNSRDYDSYPRFPDGPHARVIVFPPPIIIDDRGHHRY